MKPAPPRHRILAVDDDPDALAFFGQVLADAGYDVLCHADLAGARAALANQPLDLVLTDLYLDGNALGYEVAEMARAKQPPVPVILVTGNPTLEGAHEAIRSQVRQIVVKPCPPETLLSACRWAIDEWSIRRRNERLQAQLRVLTDIVPRCIEVNDPMTAGHSERVVGYSETLARHCRLDESEYEALRLASLLHDVGKIGIPQSILGKEGPLTPDEREVVKRHPKMGYEILAPLEGHERARRWVYQHHERWDGKGYPERLAGEEVELPGRILVLAEVFDALRSTRSYKQAWEVPRIVDFFRDQAGKHFDPDLAHLVADGLERSGLSFFSNQPGHLF